MTDKDIAVKEQHETDTTKEVEPPVDPGEVVSPLEDPSDPDYAALVELRKQSETDDDESKGEDGKPEAESAAKPEETEGKPAAGADTVPAEQTGEQQPAETPMIPLPRFQEVNSRLDEARIENARLMGRLEAIQAMGGQTGTAAGEQQPGEAEPTAAEKIAAIREEQAGVAKRFDEGEITLAEAEGERARLDDRIWDIRQDELTKANVTAQQPQAEAAGVQTDLYREERLGQLEDQHPYTRLIREDAHWDFLVSETHRLLNAEGRTIDPRNPADDLVFRTRMAELTDTYGPNFTGIARETLGGGAPSDAGHQTQNQPERGGTAKPGEMSDEAKARDAKLDMAQRMPPDVSQLGGANAAADVWTDERVAALSEEEYEALPDATRAAIARKFGDGSSHPT